MNIRRNGRHSVFKITCRKFIIPSIIIADSTFVCRSFNSIVLEFNLLLV